VLSKSKTAFILTLACAGLAAAATRSEQKVGKTAGPVRQRAAAAAAARREAAVARSWLRHMTLRDKAAQLVFMSFYGDAPNSGSEEYQKYLRWVRDLKIGGLALVNRVVDGSTRYSEPYATAAFLNRMQRAARIPLLIGGDFERGDSMRILSAAKFPHSMAFGATGDPALSRMEGAVTARQARALGIDWILAPVADVNNNPDNPIINIRSYGEDPELVAAHVRAYVEGAHSDPAHNVLVTLKHFPGHGDTNTDSHMALPVLNVEKARLEAIELVPFRAGIAAGADSVMSAHIALPAIDPAGVPSTLSPAILTGILREELGFNGLVSTDALNMQGVAKQWGPAQAAEKAVLAGADILLMPADPETGIEGVLEAVKRGRITRKRLDESVMRILAAKAHLGLNRSKTVKLESLMDELDSPEDIAKAQEVADKAVTLVKNDGDLVPVAAGRSVSFLILPESRCSTEGRQLAEEVRKRMPKAVVSSLWPAMTGAEIEQAVAATAGSDTVVVAAFAQASAYRGSVALAGSYPKLIEELGAAGRKIVLIAFGNPYLARSFPQAGAYMTTYSTVAPSEIAAVKALFGEIAISGRLPVSIPGVAKLGDGIQMPKK
jgi:beta-N-acetylhexosaminidase